MSDRPNWLPHLEVYKEMDYSELEKLAKEIHDTHADLNVRAEHAMALLKATKEKRIEFVEDKYESVQDAIRDVEGLDKIIEDFGKIDYLPGSKQLDRTHVDKYAAKMLRSMLTTLSGHEDFKGVFGAPVENDEYFLDHLLMYIRGAEGMPGPNGKALKAEEIEQRLYSLLHQRKGKKAAKFLKDILASYHANKEGQRFFKNLLPPGADEWRGVLGRTIGAQVESVEGLEDIANHYQSMAQRDPQFAITLATLFQEGDYKSLAQIKPKPDATRGPGGYGEEHYKDSGANH